MSVDGINRRTAQAAATDNTIDATEARQIVAEHQTTWQADEISAISGLARGNSPHLNGARVSPAAQQVFAEALRPRGGAPVRAVETNVWSNIGINAAKGYGIGALAGVAASAPTGGAAIVVTYLGGTVIGTIGGALYGAATANYD